MRISMDGKGRALDNIFTERLWRTVKYEEVYLHSYTSPREARRGLTRYLDFYNHGRLHQALAYRTPAEAYHDSHPAHPAAAGKERKQAQAHDGDDLDSISTQEGDASTLELPTFVS